MSQAAQQRLDWASEFLSFSSQSLTCVWYFSAGVCILYGRSKWQLVSHIEFMLKSLTLGDWINKTAHIFFPLQSNALRYNLHAIERTHFKCELRDRYACATTLTDKGVGRFPHPHLVSRGGWRFLLLILPLINLVVKSCGVCSFVSELFCSV